MAEQAEDGGDGGTTGWRRRPVGDDRGDRDDGEGQADGDGVTDDERLATAGDRWNGAARPAPPRPPPVAGEVTAASIVPSIVSPASVVSSYWSLSGTRATCQ